MGGVSHGDSHLRRYWVPEDSFTDTESLSLVGDTFHHICVVCRQGVGDRFEVLSRGQGFLVEIKSLGKKKAEATVIDQRPIPQLPKPPIHLALSLPKFQTVDRVVEKMVELGVTQVHLFSSDYSFAKLKPQDMKKKTERWQKIIKGATQQTGRGELMELTEIQPLRVLLETHFPDPGKKAFLAYEGEGGQGLGPGLRGSEIQSEEIWIFVGSEGGFSDQDLKLFKDYKILPISLGDQVLRVETACVTLVSILKYALGQYD
jgi:16S rRNA (uracil1498-N3)-methyltransferase